MGLPVLKFYAITGKHRDAEVQKPAILCADEGVCIQGIYREKSLQLIHISI